MRDINVAIDTDLGARAVEAVDRFLRDNALATSTFERDDQWPISRSQITGLRQVALNEPGEVTKFADNQRAKIEAKLETTKRAERQQEFEVQISFWKLVRGVCLGNEPWTLARERDQNLPLELQVEKFPPGAAVTSQQQSAKKEKQARRDQWTRDWDLEHYDAFFQRFCIHYLYEMARRTIME